MPNKAKRSNTAKKPNKVATAVKAILLILLALAIIAAAVFGIYYLTGGFGGRYSTFVVQINGKPVISSGSIALPRGSKIKVTSFSDYSFKVVAAEPEEDFTVRIDGSTVMYSDFAGDDLTAGFTFTESEDGDDSIIIDYGNIYNILYAVWGQQFGISDYSGGDIFALIITSGENTLSLTFAPGSYGTETILPNYDGIVG